MHVFVSQQLRELASTSISHAHPHEMKKLMENNQSKRARPLHELRIDHHFAFPHEACRVYRSPAVRLVTEQLAAMSSQL
jgi:hypothetical protein